MPKRSATATAKPTASTAKKTEAATPQKTPAKSTDQSKKAALAKKPAPAKKAASPKKAATATNAKAKKTSPAKKAKVEPAAIIATPPKSTLQKSISDLKRVTQKKIHKPDPHFSLPAEVVDDYDVMLNQTNIGNNNNKFYAIQVLKSGSSFYTFTRWGRVGEPGQNQRFGPYGDLKKAVEVFEKKFTGKTKNKWAKRDQFAAVAGKYTMIDVGEYETEGGPKQSGAATKENLKILSSKLDKETQEFLSLIFDTDTFKDAMESFQIDVKKMPLGQLSKAQLYKGFQCLEEIEDAIKNGKVSQFPELSSKFYTLIPHSFGRVRPPTINTLNAVQAKKDMLLVLSDIEEAQTLQKQYANTVKPNERNEVPHYLDQKYAMLECDLRRLSRDEEQWKVIDKYTNQTMGRSVKIQNIWRVDRHSEGMRFRTRAHLENHKLLWHGTNIAVVVAILKGGLRIMPHSGGRVGRGLYFASENGKSAGYVCPARNHVGVMFLNEVVLGKPHTIKMDDSSLVKPPSGFDSVIALGQTEPDPTLDTTITFEDGSKVVVPQGKPRERPDMKDSRFRQSEYLIYDEAQCRIRYLVAMKF